MKTLFKKLDDSWPILLLLSAAVSAVFLLFASVYTTPLNDYYGYDSAYYLLIGKGIRHGMLPYLDLYDQKGPLVFYINALGFLRTDSRVGVYLLQIPFMTVTVSMLYRTFRLLVDRGLAMLLILGFLCFTAEQPGKVTWWKSGRWCSPPYPCISACGSSPQTSL